MLPEKLAQTIIDAWNTQDLDQLTALYGEEAVFYDPLLGKEIKGKEVIGYAQGIYAAFPDLQFVVKDIATGPDLAMAEWSQNGTNTGPVLGKPATGRYVEIPAVSVLRFDGDRLLSHYDYWDMKKFLADLFG